MVINTIIPLYWVQSVLIGVFTFIDLLTMHNIAGENSLKVKPGCLPFFFLAHYGFFHLAYLLFMLFTGIDLSKIDWSLLKITSLILLVSMFFSFVQQKMRFGRTEGNPSTVMLLPYVRIIPMHLTIIIPSFIHVSSFMFFLVLKTVCDVVFYILYSRLRYKGAAVME